MKKRMVMLMLAGVLSMTIINNKVIETPTEVSAEESFENIENGDNGEQVKEIQSFLKSAGYLDGEADGSFGNMTENAVKNCQKDHGLEETGIVESNTFEKLKGKDVPEGLIVDEDQWKNWTAINNPSVLVFLDGCELAGCDIGLKGEQQQSHKEGTFYFKDDGASSSLDGASLYYGVESQQVNYAGLSTSDEYIYNSDRFKEACKRLMRGYASYVNKDASNSKDTLNVENSITEERASEIVDYCFDAGIEHCLVDDMRIRLIRNDTDGGYYSFHIEYSKDSMNEIEEKGETEIIKERDPNKRWVTVISTYDLMKEIKDIIDSYDNISIFNGVDDLKNMIESGEVDVQEDTADGCFISCRGHYSYIYSKDKKSCGIYFVFDDKDIDSILETCKTIFFDYGEPMEVSPCKPEAYGYKDCYMFDVQWGGLGYPHYFFNLYVLTDDSVVFEFTSGRKD